MIQKKVVINKLIASDGSVLTDGKTYGRIIYLGKNRKKDEFFEITKEEYEDILKKEQLEIGE